MNQPARSPQLARSPRHDELLELAYGYALEHGLTELSLRPLARAIGSSPRVLLFLFGSKEGLVRALLARARADELVVLGRFSNHTGSADIEGLIRATWEWLVAPGHRQLLCLWAEAYTRSIVEPTGPWAGFARQTVEDWVDLLAAGQSPKRRRTVAGAAERHLALAVLRGALLELLATGDVASTTEAVRQHVLLLRAARRRQDTGEAEGRDRNQHHPRKSRSASRLGPALDAPRTS